MRNRKQSQSGEGEVGDGERERARELSNDDDGNLEGLREENEMRRVGLS